MRIVSRLGTACLLICLAFPSLVRAGGASGENPYDVGEKLFSRKHYRTALKYYQKAATRNDLRAHYRMGLAYEATGRDADALGQYRRFVDAGLPGADRDDAARRAKSAEERLKRKADLLERGRSLFQKGSYREAEKALLQAVAADPARAEAHFLLGDVYLKLEAYGKAKSEYQKARDKY